MDLQLVSNSTSTKTPPTTTASSSDAASGQRSNTSFTAVVQHHRSSAAFVLDALASGQDLYTLVSNHFETPVDSLLLTVHGRPVKSLDTVQQLMVGDHLVVEASGRLLGGQDPEDIVMCPLCRALISQTELLQHEKLHSSSSHHAHAADAALLHKETSGSSNSTSQRSQLLLFD